MEIGEKSICFEEFIFSPDFPDSNKCGVPSDEQFVLRNLYFLLTFLTLINVENSIVILFGGI